MNYELLYFMEELYQMVMAMSTVSFVIRAVLVLIFSSKTRQKDMEYKTHFKNHLDEIKRSELMGNRR